MLLSITEFIGRFHPVIVHLPIGVLLLALLLQWISFKPRYHISTPVLKLVWWIGIAGALISCITGYLLSLKGDYAADLVNIHMWMGIAVALTSLFVASKVFTGDFKLMYKLASIMLLLLIMVTGHFGGSLTHGSDYLLTGWDDTEEVAAVQEEKLIANVQEAKVYSDVIEPMLSSKCYSCHGSKKQKGKLRLDSPDGMMKGGKDGKVLVNGDPENSEMLKRILLPLEEDDHMPPKQKPQLKEGQVNLIRWWIEQGCSFDKKVNELPQTDKIRTLLMSLENGKSSREEPIKLFPEAPVEAADEKAVSKLIEKGVMVIPVAAGSNYLSVNFITAENFSDADMKWLAPLNKQLVSLKAGNTKLTDESLKVIASCKQLVLLHLNNTLVTDKGMGLLKTLKNLQSLNLVDTKVSINGIAPLNGLKQLKHLYLYNSAVLPKHYIQLKATFPKTIIDTGGYRLPNLPSDTEFMTKPRKVDGES